MTTTTWTQGRYSDLTAFIGGNWYEISRYDFREPLPSEYVARDTRSDWTVTKPSLDEAKAAAEQHAAEHPYRQPKPEPRRARYTLHGQVGAASRATSSGTVRFDPGDPERESAIQALARRIERETRLSCYPVRQDSWAADGSSSTYEITLVRPIPRRDGGGYSVQGSLWATVYR